MRLAKLISKLNNIQFVIAITSILLAIIPMSYTSISLYTKYANEMLNNSEVFTSQIMEQLRYNIDEYLSSSIKNNEEVERMLVARNNVIDSDFESMVNSYFSSRTDIVSIRFFDLYGNSLFGVPNNEYRMAYQVINESWFEDVVNNNIFYYVSKPHVQQEYTHENNWVISVVKLITLNDSGETSEGILKVDISINQLDNLCNSLNLGGSGYVFITDQNNQVIYHPQQALIASGLKEEITPEKQDSSGLVKTSNGSEVLSITKTMSFVDWKLVGVTHIEAITEKNTRILQGIMIVIPIILLAIVMLSWLISGMISSPIKELESKMRRVQNGDFDALIHLNYGEREVVELVNSYNIMLSKIKELMEKNRQEHEAKRQSELNALQAQINPHFLYNTLDSIMWMAESGQNEEVVEMVTALARLFRISISKGRKRITVYEELEHARNYMLIQKRRYKEKFNFNIYVDEEVKHLLTLKLILQPIIENAIYHGIEYMVDDGEINIRVEVTETTLVFIVEDNGLGMDEATRLALLDSKQTITASRGGSGVGVRNVDERIKLSYGNAYGLIIESEIEEGTRVRIVMPRIEEDNL